MVAGRADSVYYEHTFIVGQSTWDIFDHDVINGKLEIIESEEYFVIMIATTDVGRYTGFGLVLDQQLGAFRRVGYIRAEKCSDWLRISDPQCIRVK